MRVFIGVELSENVRGACVEMMRMLAQQAEGRWTLAENLHLTLAFVGEVDPAQTEKVAAILREAAARFELPRMGLAGVGVFEKKRNAILYARVQCEPELAPLHTFLTGALRDAGLPADPGPFTPHITLARKAQFQGEMGGISTPEASFCPACLTLFESARDESDVLRYTPIRRVAWKNSANHVEK